jgi:hypothetical protein
MHFDAECRIYFAKLKSSLLGDSEEKEEKNTESGSQPMKSGYNNIP